MKESDIDKIVQDKLMCIKFDDFDMLDFFENEPVFVGEEEGGESIYSIKDRNSFTLILTTDIYAKKIDISITHENNTVFAGQFQNIFEIRKSEDVLLVEMEGKKRLVIKKEPCLGVLMEDI